MSSNTLFNQTCPVCGRKLRITIELLGQSVICQHCRGQFVARAESRGRDPDVSLLELADELLATFSEFYCRKS